MCLGNLPLIKLPSSNMQKNKQSKLPNKKTVYSKRYRNGYYAKRQINTQSQRGITKITDRIPLDAMSEIPKHQRNDQTSLHSAHLTNFRRRLLNHRPHPNHPPYPNLRYDQNYRTHQNHRPHQNFQSSQNFQPKPSTTTKPERLVELPRICSWDDKKNNLAIPVRITQRQNYHHCNSNNTSNINSKRRSYMVPINLTSTRKVPSRESGFAVPKFMFINICSLAKTKN